MSSPFVQTRSGPLCGTQAENGCLAFLGIPYAEPPVGDLRFRPPRPVRPWTEPREATRFGAAAVQVYMPEMGPPVDFYDVPPEGPVTVVGDEDCLTLNVWTPALDGGLRPVYVWIHGGANHLESSRLPIYHGDALCRLGDIVVVSLNYRLGAFGFMDVEPILGPEYRGAFNNGLRDQFLALHWIRDNIAAFGGDPENITLGGESAGGMDVSWHLVSGRLRGMIRRAVVMSDVIGPAGIGGDGPAYRHDPQTVRAISLDVMTRAGIDTAVALTGLSGHDLCARIGAIPFGEELFGLDGQFYPGLDGETWAQEPLAAVSAGALDGIDLLIGYTNYEAGLWLSWNPELLERSPAWIAERFGFLSDKTQAAAVAAYAQFFPTEPPGVQAMHLVSDCGFTLPVTWFAERAAARGAKVWMYRFDLEVDETRKAMHAADLPFFFARPHEACSEELIGPASGPDAVALRDRLCAEMAGALIAFIRDGSPAVPCLPDWPRFDPAGRATMIFDPVESHVTCKPLGARQDFWNETLGTTFVCRNAASCADPQKESNA